MSRSRGPRASTRCVDGRCRLYVEAAGAVYVAEPLCPHAKWPLDVFGVFFERDGVPHVVCKIHWGIWNLATGEGRFPNGRPAPPLRVYREL
jgi:nitrite reductase/ring-hydroxylating ferredoxin subunit